MTLTDFLLARIAEDEQRALEVHTVEKAGSVIHQYRVGTWQISGGPVNGARMVADCEVKRWIVETFVPSDYVNYKDPEILRWLAKPYADHPDFRDEWLP